MIFSYVQTKERNWREGDMLNFDADFFVPMDSLGDAQVKNNTFE